MQSLILPAACFLSIKRGRITRSQVLRSSQIMEVLNLMLSVISSNRDMRFDNQNGLNMKKPRNITV
jgi:hypothetical protein